MVDESLEPDGSGGDRWGLETERRRGQWACKHIRHGGIGRRTVNIPAPPLSRDSVLDAVFGGVEHQLVKCSVCGDDSVKMTPVRTIHLSLPSEASVTCELEAALRSNMQGVGGCSEGVRACVRACVCMCLRVLRGYCEGRC